MKDLYAKSKANAAARLSRMGGKRSSYAKGGDAKCYASGGSVGSDMGEPDGMPSKPNFGKPGRSGGKGKGKPGDKKKGGTNVNVIVMPSGGGDKGPGPMPPPGGPPPMPPHGPPMMGPPPGGPGGPPPGLPMRKFGGSVKGYAKGGRIGNLGKYAHGGKVKAK